MNSMTRIVSAKTGNYTVVNSGDETCLFTNRGAAGSVTFTLPDATATPSGWWCEFFVVEAQTVNITATPTDTLVVFNDKAADTFQWSTAGSIIGNGARVVCDGTGWLLLPFSASSDAATPLVARNTITT